MTREIEIPCVGYKIKADLYEGETTDRVMLFLIGFTSSKASYEPLVTALVKKTGLSALVLDYGGHGESPFNLEDLTQSQNFSESVIAFDWIRNSYPDSKITVIGTSYGGYHASLLAGYREFDQLVLRVPGIYPWHNFYTKWSDMESVEEHRRHRQDPELVSKHPLLLEASRKFSGRTLVLTHENDDVCPKVSTDEFTKLFNANTWVANDFGHSFTSSNPTKEQGEEYQAAIADWIKK
ncbi:MAG: pimeloyl-ACP methyl ester carboxylesterase [Candidatus Saccharimonadales bacterium]|jgi:pimeloyl-ACP methyl ester carboxylesterase